MPANRPLEATMRLAAAIFVILAAFWSIAAGAADATPPGAAMSSGSGRWGFVVSTSPQQADLTPLRDRISSVGGMSARVVPMKDPGGTTTGYILTAGDFSTSAAAYEARGAFAEKVGLPAASLQVIELPR
jgi:hypothetical protein